MASVSIKDLKNIRITTFLILLFSLVTYSIFFSSLVLFITNGLEINDVTATSIAATFFAFHFGLQILGGFLTGRFFSHRTLLAIGLILQSIGCVFLSYYNLYWGLAFFLSGTGFNIICTNCLLNQFFSPSDKRRESSFLINYTAMNVGAVIGASISGLFEIHQNYSSLFIFGALTNLIPFGIILYKWKFLKDRKTFYSALSIKKKRNLIILGLSYIAALIIFLRWVVKNSQYSNIIIFSLGIAVIFYILSIALKNNNAIGKKIWAYFIFILTSLIFWTLNLMSPMGLVLFIENNVKRNVFNISIPPQWFINVTSFTIILAAPFLVSLFKSLRKKGYNISITNQFIAALLCIGIGFLILPIGIQFANSMGYVNFLFVIVSYIFIGLGEVLFAPIGYAMIGEIIPHKSQNLMMGIWIMITGVSATITNMFSKLAVGATKSENPLLTNPQFFKSFSILATVALLTALILFLLSKFINKIIKEK